MTTKGAMKLVATVITLVIGAPIWYYLLYKILVAVNATDLMWFLYWVYVPVGILASILMKIAEAAE